ncbi:MarC family protein [Phyllobacterium phragmitis]|uniref:MarC family protein n=1 Tax=Phyllobacterium phragmitis TaxID=2670329 RepID=UPI001FDEC4A9|nr:MarC family protein [Phyllobacterium phragmitis]
MSNIIHALFLTYAALFPIVNPLGGALIFLNVTNNCSQQMRHRLAWRVAVGGFLVLACSLFSGSYILGFFGISLPAVRIAGGLVIAAMGWKMLNSSDSPVEASPASVKSDEGALDLAFYPLTMPLTFGPGAIATAITIGSQQPDLLTDFDRAAVHDVAVIIGLLAICATVYLAYRYADELKRVLGKNGTSVLVRLSAFIVLCIGIQIIWFGIADLVQSLSH